MNDSSEMDIYRKVIKDKNIWLYIFGKEKPNFDSAQSYYRYINNTINLTFVYVFSCIKEMYSVVEDIETKKKLFNPNARRAIKNLDRIYSGFDVTYELINYILLDVQFDLALGAESCLKRFIPGITAEFNVLDYSQRILHWMTTSKYEQDISITDLIQLFQKLINSLPYISSSSLQGEGNDTYFETQIGFDSYTFYTDYRLFIQDCGRGYYQFYFLERIENKKHSLTLSYSTPDYSDKYYLIYHDSEFNETINEDNSESFLSDKDDMDMIYNRIVGGESDDVFANAKVLTDGISNIYTVNYKYLKNLSLSISDELGKSDNSISRDKLLQKYGFSIQDDLDLDSVIIMQLIEKSPSIVLFDLFCIDGSLFHQIIKNIYNRFNSKIKFKYIDFTKNPVDYTELDNQLLRKLRKSHDVYHNMEMAELQSNYIISMILADSRKGETRVERISDVILDINSSNELEVAQDACARLLIKLCCFYKGVISYGVEKLEYDAEYYDSMPSPEKIRDTQERFSGVFLDSSEEYYLSEIKSQLTEDKKHNLAFAIDKFIELVNQVDGDVDMKKALKCVIGRNNIVDNKVFGLSSSVVSLGEAEQKKEILRILEFVTTGSFEKNEARGDFNSSIYPVTGKYISNSESNDRCRIAIFSIRIDIDANGKNDYMKNISILSEFNYQIDEYYYCLPNISRSNMDWWIDPLVINAGKFDRIFSEKENE